MILGFDFSDIPGDAIALMLLMLISFLGWIKNRFFSRREEEEEVLTEEEERMREVVWRRQMGEEVDRAPWENDPTVWQPEPAQPPPLPPAIPKLAPAPEPVSYQPPSVREVSDRERQLAESFEHRGRGRRRQGTTGRDDLIQVLSGPEGARKGILLAEILGPPVALRQSGENQI